MKDKYIVWPQDGTRTDDTSTILIEIQRILSSDAEIVASDTKDLGVNFWRVLMDSDRADEVRHIANMAYISANKGSDNKRYNEHYYFDISAGEDIPVYIVDTGAQMDHIEFTLRDNIASKTEFIFVGEDIDAHGTAMLSIIAGANIGIAKKVKPIMGHQSEDFRRDWVKKNKEKVQDAEKEAFEQWARFRLRMHRILTSLIAKGVFIVTGSGNAFVRRQTGDKKSFYKFSQGTSDATAYTAGLAAYFLKLHQLGRLGPDAKGNPPDMSPAGLKRYIINNGWVRQNEDNNGVLGIWNGATIESLEREGFCSGTVAPTAIPTTFVCTEETADKCAPGVVCSKPKVNGAPQNNGCVDGKCVCVLPDLASKTTAVQTTLSTVTSKPPDPAPTPTETPKTPVVIGERKCHDASIYTGKTDIWKSSVYDASLRACTECETPMKAGSETRRRDDSWGGVRYDMSISWRSGYR
ncbi:Sexual differentiation process putative subtilase-type proteinase isp6 [Colletotrichum sp. SAR 10_99]|nr:Sexual differentiation process putative subtilase-type proteinase isp6 [Colletotrichum sp. SAR 10_96]KAJ5013736.1 Sexual differentiation process putative subtilase-type proteinase isp6 [Colletotrichum sp. SAR 10_99]